MWLICMINLVSSCWGIPERFEVINGEVIASQVKHGVLQGASMAIGQHKAVTIKLHTEAIVR